MNYFDYSLIPAHMMEAINRYVEEGQELGGFLTSVMSNDLFKASFRADERNKDLLHVYVRYIFNECPESCHGCLENVNSWYKMKRKEKNS